jgi:polyisoprenoid-binding protein YceI
MRRFCSVAWSAALLVALVGGGNPARADKFTVDDAHTAVTFKVSHLGLSWVYGRFNDVGG